MILLHIIGGLVGLTSGTVALSSSRGWKLHRKSGIIFVYAMLVMSASGAVMAALQPERISIIAGLLTFYLVTTAWLTVRRRAAGIIANVLLARACVVHAVATAKRMNTLS